MLRDLYNSLIRDKSQDSKTNQLGSRIAPFSTVVCAGHCLNRAGRRHLKALKPENTELFDNLIRSMAPFPQGSIQTSI